MVRGTSNTADFPLQNYQTVAFFSRRENDPARIAAYTDSASQAPLRQVRRHTRSVGLRHEAHMGGMLSDMRRTEARAGASRTQPLAVQVRSRRDHRVAESATSTSLAGVLLHRRMVPSSEPEAKLSPLGWNSMECTGP